VLAVYQRWLNRKIAIKKKNKNLADKQRNEQIRTKLIKTKATTTNDNRNLFHSVHHGEKSQCQFYIKIVVAALISVNLQFYKTSYLLNSFGYTSHASNGLNHCSAGFLILFDGHWDRL